jgi:hypothetical protein
MENWKKMLAAYRDTLKGIEADEKLSDAGKAEARNEAFGRIKEARRKLAADYENRKAEIDAELAAMKRPSPPTLEAGKILQLQHEAKVILGRLKVVGTRQELQDVIRDIAGGSDIEKRALLTCLSDIVDICSQRWPNPEQPGSPVNLSIMQEVHAKLHEDTKPQNIKDYEARISELKKAKSHLQVAMMRMDSDLNNIQARNAQANYFG